MSIEQRRYERLNVAMDVSLLTKAARHEALIKNISLGGCYIETQLPVDLRSLLDIEMRFPTGHWVPMRGTIMYHNPGGGFGLRFEFQSDTQENLIARLIEHIRETQKQ